MVREDVADLGCHWVIKVCGRDEGERSSSNVRMSEYVYIAKFACMIWRG